MPEMPELGRSNNSGSQARQSSDVNEMINQCFSVFRKLERQSEDMTNAINHILGPKLEAMEGRVRNLEGAVEKISHSIKSATNSTMTSSRPRCLQLQFCNKVASSILTGEEIKDAGGDLIEIALFDDSGKLVDCGPEAFANVKIVALKCDSDENGHKGKLADINAETPWGKGGKNSVLVGNLQLKLSDGTGLISNIKFRSSARHNSGIFKLVARIVDTFDGTQVKDAETEPFNVKDYRKKYKEKRDLPSLSDYVLRLRNISKGGAVHERLKKEEAYTVEDLLILNLKDSERLKQILDLPLKKWEDTMNHARTCITDNKVYCSIGSGEDKGVAFNVVGQVKGLILGTKYVHLDELSEGDKIDARKLLAAAFKHQDAPILFNDEASLVEHLSERFTQLNPLPSLLLDSPSTDREDKASEVSACDQSLSTFQEIATTSNSTFDMNLLLGEAVCGNEVDSADCYQLPDLGIKWLMSASPTHYHEEWLLSSLTSNAFVSQSLADESQNDYLCVNTTDPKSPAVSSYPDIRKRLVIFFTISRLLMLMQRMSPFNENNCLKKQRVD